MKRSVAYIVALLAIMCCLFADSCSQREEFLPELSISAGGRNLSGSSLNYDESGGSDAIEVKSNSDWKIECNADWLDISPRSGSGRGSVELAVAPSDKSRSCVVTIAMQSVAQMRHSFDVIQYVAERPSPDEPNNPNNPEDTPSDTPSDEPTDGPSDNPSDEPADPENPENPNDPDNPNEPEEPSVDPENPENPDDPENPENPNNPEPGNPDTPVEPEQPTEPEQPEIPEQQTPLAITIPELIATMPDDGTPIVIDAERDRVLSAVVMNNPDGANYPTSHLIVATEGSTAPHNGVVIYGRIVKPDLLGVKCGDRVEVVLKAGLAVAIKNNSVMYEITGDASKQWAEVNIVARNVKVDKADVTPAELASYQGMTVRLKSVTPLSEGVWNEPGTNGEVEFSTESGEKFTVQVLESAKFASRQYHIAQGDICGIVAIDGKKVVLRPRTVEDIAPFDGPAPEEPKEEEPTEPKEDPEDKPADPTDPKPEQPVEPETPVEPEQPTEPEPETPVKPEQPEQPTEPEPETPAEPEKPTEPTQPEQPTTPTTPAEKYTEIKSLSELGEGHYYIGGYRDGQLYLATGEMTAQWHGTTAAYNYQQGEFSADEESDATPAEVILERADNGKGYYIRFADKGYLVAIAAKAGALRFSDNPDNYWIFSQHAEQGFEVRQAGDIDVQLIISQTASDALLRSVAGDAEGLGIVLFRHNK